MAKGVQKSKAILLRKKGKSLSEIAQELGVSKGSVSIWVRDIELSKSAQKNLSLKIQRGFIYAKNKGLVD